MGAGFLKTSTVNSTSMIKHPAFLASLLLGIGLNLHAKDNFWDSPDAYLGQKPPSEKPVEFAPGMLADPKTIAMDRIAISPDGKDIVYVQNDQWYNLDHAKVKEFRFDGHRWNGPSVVLAHYCGLSFSNDGNSLFFTGENVYEVWQMTRTAAGWGVPTKYIGKPFALYEFLPTLSGNAYMGTNPDKRDAREGRTSVVGEVDAPVEKAAEVRSLGVPLNEPGFNGDFFVARDESFMVVSAKETSDNECELYISYRKPDHTWTNPKSLGPLINDGAAHRWGQFVTPDNKYLFYSHGTSAQDCSIYWVRFDRLLERLRHTNFEPYVRTPIGLKEASAGNAFSFTVCDTTFFDDDANDPLSYSAASASGQALPDWLHFDPATRSFSGTPAQGGAYRVAVTATDPAGAKATCTFSLSVAGKPQEYAARATQDYSTINRSDWSLPETNAVGYAFETYEGSPALVLKRKVMDSKSASIAYPKGLHFKDGIIEFDAASPGGESGYLGLAFRIRDEHRYETLYFRPGSSETANAVQYMPEKKDEFNWPDYEDLKYQSAATLPLKKWFHVKVLVKGRTLTVYLGDQPAPVFVYDDLDASLPEGSVGFWLGNSPSGAYRNLKVSEF
jgi:Putative Ig domain